MKILRFVMVGGRGEGGAGRAACMGEGTDHEVVDIVEAHSCVDNTMIQDS